MKKETAQEAKKLLEELESIEKAHSFYFSEKDRKLRHFSVMKHYNPTSDTDYVTLPKHLNKQFLEIIESEIDRVETALQNLS